MFFTQAHEQRRRRFSTFKQKNQTKNFNFFILPSSPPLYPFLYMAGHPDPDKEEEDDDDNAGHNSSSFFESRDGPSRAALVAAGCAASSSPKGTAPAVVHHQNIINKHNNRNSNFNNQTTTTMTPFNSSPSQEASSLLAWDNWVRVVSFLFTWSFPGDFEVRKCLWLVCKALRLACIEAEKGAASMRLCNKWLGSRLGLASFQTLRHISVNDIILPLGLCFTMRLLVLSIAQGTTFSN